MAVQVAASCYEMSIMKLDLFDYDLPPALIAQEPLTQRDASRMLVLHRGTGKIEHRKFLDLAEYIYPQDALVFNQSKVIKARLQGHRDTGGKVEIFLLQKVKNISEYEAVYEALVRATASQKAGMKVDFGSGRIQAQVLEQKPGDMVFLVHLKSRAEEWLQFAIEAVGQIPLPPYITRAAEENDSSRYQTIYAAEEGSVAAPTAGLHFTPNMSLKLAGQGTKLFYVTLHVGLGTFQPIKVENIEEHKMHTEYFSVPENLLDDTKKIRANGGRVIGVGTTSVRTLESVARGMKEKTNIYLKPGEEFLAVDGMLTNFHQAKSSLLVMLSAFVGREKLLDVYQEAIREKYRFFSYGDCMLVL